MTEMQMPTFHQALNAMNRTTVDPRTSASNQALMSISRRDYARYRSSFRPIQDIIFATTFLPISGGNGWLSMYEHFICGDLNPAIVVDASRNLVATYTDLSSTHLMSFPVIKVFREKLDRIRRPVREGDTFAAVSLYYGDGQLNGIQRWNGFIPIVANCVVEDEEICAFAKAKIPDSHWQALTVGLSQLPAQIKRGAIRIQLPRSLEEQLRSE